MGKTKSSVPLCGTRIFSCSLQLETDGGAALHLTHWQLSVPGRQATGFRDDLTYRAHADALLWGQEGESM